MRPPRRASKTSTSRSTRRRCGGGSPTTRRSSHGCVLRRCRQEERRWRPPADHEYLSSEATKHRRSTFLGEATGYQAGLCPMRDVKGRRHLPIHCREAMIRDRAQASARWAAAAVAFACALGAVLLTLLPAAALATPAAQDLESLQAQAKQARAEVARLDYASQIAIEKYNVARSELDVVLGAWDFTEIDTQIDYFRQISQADEDTVTGIEAPTLWVGKLVAQVEKDRAVA